MDNYPKFFDDDGTEINPDFQVKPQLCYSCKNNDDPEQEMLCGLTRNDQRDEPTFQCEAYSSISER